MAMRWAGQLLEGLWLLCLLQPDLRGAMGGRPLWCAPGAAPRAAASFASAAQLLFSRLPPTPTSLPSGSCRSSGGWCGWRPS